MKRILNTLIVLLLVIFVFSACSNNGANPSDNSNTTSSQSGSMSESGKIELEAISFMGEETKRSGFSSWVSAFCNKNPGVTITAQHLDYGSYTTTLQTRIGSGDAPDLIFGTGILNQQLIKSGQIMDITEEPVLEKFTQDDLACMTIDGKIYGVPLDKMIIGVFYNKDMFDEYELEVPETLSDFYNAIKTFEDNGIIPFVRQYKDAAYVQYDLDTQLYPILARTGNLSFFTDLEEGKTTFAESAEMREALELFAKRLSYTSGDDLGTDPSVAIQLLASGECPMYIDGSWIIGDLLTNNPDGNFGVFATPISENKEENLIYAAVDDAWMISSQTEYSEASLDFLDFITSEEGLTIWANTAKTITLKEVVTEDMPDLLTDISELINSGRFVNVDKYVYFSSEATDIFNMDMQLFVSEKDVDSMLAKLDSDFNNIVN